MKQMPLLLILFRLLCAPVILILAYTYEHDAKPMILTLMYLGLISDILDGIIARKENVSSAKLRRMDSQVDMVFWLSIGWATYQLYPHLINAHLVEVWAILIMEAMCYVISIARFKRETCTHAWLSKLFGLSMLVAFTSLIGYDHAGIPFYTALILGLISHVDRILITLVIPRWTHDIPTSYHAYLLRKGKRFNTNVWLNSTSE